MWREGGDLGLEVCTQCRGEKSSFEILAEVRFSSHQCVQFWWRQLDKLSQEGISNSSTPNNADFLCGCNYALP